jgi:plastocyanin
MVMPMRSKLVPAALCAAFLTSGLPARPSRAAPAAPSSAVPWQGEELPLPLAVRTPEEIALKAEAERQYLLFNLLAGGKAAYDAGDHRKAVQKWETLLRLPGLSPSVERAVLPLLQQAQRLAGQPVTAAPAQAPAEERRDEGAPAPAAPAAEAMPTRITVTGLVSGGGAIGPGGAVLWLKRTDGPTPPVRPGRPRVVSQKNKLFIPRVLAVPVGTRVDFRNDDDFYHNVFSLSDPARFDTGLYPSGKSHGQTFTKAGPVELLCNIHATMLGYVYVVDSPFYTQPNTTGAFTIRNVPPGRYELFAWHEAAGAPVRQKIVVDRGMPRLSVEIPNDRRPPATVPDKYGKPRHLQLGY